MLVGVFVFGGSGAQRASAAQGATGVHGPIGCMGPPRPTINDPLGGTKVSLGDAGAALGRPLVLPDSGQATASDVGKVWLYQPHVGPTGVRGAVVAVTFPKAGVWVDYQTGIDTYPDDILLEYQAIAHQNGDFFRVMDLSGIPALGGAPRPDDHCSIGSVMFNAGGVGVTVLGHNDLATKTAIAQSIVDGSAAPPDGQLGRVGGIQLFSYYPPARRVDLADASATLGGPVVLPDTSLVTPSDAGPIWAERSCPAPSGPATAASDMHACWLWVSFPSARLIVGYLRSPMYRDYKNEWKLQATQYGATASAFQLGSIQALAIEPSDPFPGSVEFDLNGTRVVVAGNYDPATLRDVAQSIIDRSTS